MANLKLNQNINALDLATIKLGIDGVSTNSDVSSIKSASQKLSEAVANFSPNEMNHFITDLTNKVITSDLYKSLEFSDPFVRHFFQVGEHYSAYHEVIDHLPLEAKEFNPDLKIPTDRISSPTLQTIIKTKAKRVIRYSFTYDVMKAAFRSPQAFGAWYSRVIENMRLSVQLHTYKEILEDIKNEITTELELSNISGWDQVLYELNKIAHKMSLPTTEFNLRKQENGVDRTLKIQTSKYSDLVLITTPETLNDLEMKVSASKIHNSYFDVKKFGTVITVPSETLTKHKSNKEVMYLFDKSALYGRWRLNQTASQFFANNLETEVYIHFWWLFGAIPWANGLRIFFDKPTKENVFSLGKVDTK